MKKVTKVLAILSAAGGAAYLAKKVQEAGGVEKFVENVSKKVRELPAKCGKESVDAKEVAGTSNVCRKDALEKYKGVTDFSNWSDEEVAQFANDVIYSENLHKDPFWEDTEKCLLIACVKLLIDYCGSKSSDGAGVLSNDVKDQLFSVLDKTKVAGLRPDFASLQTLLNMAYVPKPENDGSANISVKNKGQELSKLAVVFKNIENRFLDAGKFEMPQCVSMWNCFRLAPEKTASSVVPSLSVKIGTLTK